MIFTMAVVLKNCVISVMTQVIILLRYSVFIHIFTYLYIQTLDNIDFTWSGIHLQSQIGTFVIEFIQSAKYECAIFFLQDAMALVRKFGKPELFITFTSNPRWPEISASLLEGQTAADRPDIVNRVFQLKLKQLFTDLFTTGVLGDTKAYCWTLEEQKRSLKHAHILSILQQPLTPEWVERTVWAIIPDLETMPRLHKIVTECMLHGPCGTFKPDAPCMVDGKCKAGYPKPWNETTQLCDDGFAKYARPKGVTFQKNGFIFDNR